MIIEHFQGDSLIIDGELLNDLGAPVDLVAEAVTIRSEVRLQGWRVGEAPIANFVVTKPTNTQYTLTALDTSTWAIGLLECNVRYVKDGKTFSTHTFAIKCKRSPTQ